MGLEAGTYVSDLVLSNPADSDLESQGAAHLRLIKTVLQNTFPNANRVVGVPQVLSKSSDYSVLKGDAQSIIMVDTTIAIVNLTMPTLAAGDDGWEVQVVKTNTGTNPVLIKPPAGTLSSGAISGLSATRRCIPNTPTRVIWTGTAFICTRAIQAPVGAIIEYGGSTLPVGYEWPNGQTLGSAATNYPDFFSANGSSGVTVDRRERFALAGLLGGADPGRVTNAVSGIDPTTLGSAGGAQSVTLAQANLPNATLGYGGANGQAGDASAAPSTAGTSTAVNVATPTAYQAGAAGANNPSAPTTITMSAQKGQTSSLNGGVAQTAVAKMLPAIIQNFILVVE